MTDIITLTGLVATSPRHIVTSEGLTITSFRLASNQRRFDRTQNAWVDGDTNWYTITAFRQLGTHVATSVEKGQRVIVTGRVRIRDWESGEKSGTTIEIDAESIGHDLTWGRATFTRSVIAAKTETTETSPADGGSLGDAGEHETTTERAAVLDADSSESELEFAASGAATPF